MNTNAFRLVVKFLSYWHAGGGREGRGLDAVVHRDAAGLPVVPGRHLKGLLRDALERAEAWGWFGTGNTNPPLSVALFGDRSRNGGATPVPGCLRASDARLPDELATWLASPRTRDLRPHLFRALHQTAIDPANGQALDRSLRATELAVPLTLVARLEVVPGRTAPTDWAVRLRRVLPLVDALGAHRTRGLGRAVLSLDEIP